LNSVQLEGLLTSKTPLRFTPAGLPAQEAVMSVQEAGKPDFDVSLASFGDTALALSKAGLGTVILLTGRLQKAHKSSAKLNILIDVFELK
jgi:primosomal replication protein N